MITPEFITETYGSPREGPYYKTDRSRAFFNMAFCREFKQYNDEIDYAEIEAAHNKLKVIHDYLGSGEFRLQLFGEKNADKFESADRAHDSRARGYREAFPTALRENQIGSGVQRRLAGIQGL